MKHFVVVMAILMCAFGEAAESKGQDAKSATSTAQNESVQPESTVIFQGLIAYVENESGAAGPPVEALLVNALPDPNVNIQNATGPLDLLSGKPVILNAEIVSRNGMALPPHEPFVAVENGTIEGENCFIGKGNTDLHLDWELKEVRGEKLVLQARRLCAIGVCGKMTLNIGNEPLDQAKVDLKDLADLDDFSAHNCQAGFFSLDQNIDNKLAARVEIAMSSELKARTLNCTSFFNTHSLVGPTEDACGSGGGRKFAEQVEARGRGEVTLARGAEICRFVPERDKAMKVWIFNIHAASYHPGHYWAHHPAFYWYYNLASTPCKFIGGAAEYPRLCPGSTPGCYGDPKCPQVRLTR